MTLRNRKILVTRRAEQAAEMVREIERCGAVPVVIPLIAIAPPPSWDACDRALGALSSYDLLAFTSANAVESFTRRADERGVARGTLARIPALAVGDATAGALRARGMSVSGVPAAHSGAALAEGAPGGLRGKRVLLPQGDIARADAAASLRRAGAEVETVTVYASTVPDGFDAARFAARVLAAEFDAVAFASPSAAGRFAGLFSPRERAALPGRLAIAAIGHTTAEALRGLGLPPAVIAREATARGLVQAIEEYFEERE